MNRKRLTCAHVMHHSKSQQGAILIMSMTILLLMTVVGLASIRSSGIQMKMASNQQVRQKVFLAAENALTLIEQQILLDYSDGFMEPDVTDCTIGEADCYDAGCGGGLCFRGYHGGVGALCDLWPSPALTGPVPYWERPNFWDDANAASYLSFPVTDSRVASVKFIKEFMCYVDSDPADPVACDAGANCASLVRITALATGEDERTKVMLQSTVKLPLE